ncbi:MAG: hypothetical protein ABI901_12925 [Roseiflexaceae bacterium]
MRYKLPILAVLVLTLVATQPAFAALSPAASFQNVWSRYDQPVADQSAGRSWTWGPAPISGLLGEDFRLPGTQPPLPDGKRMVQYFDKGRMEINDPDGDATSPWFVTSGLLPIELMTGNKQTAYDQYARWKESYISAIGDPGSFPAYPDLITLYKSPGDVQPAALGKPVIDFLNLDLTITQFTDYASDPATVLLAGSNNYGVPRAFVDFQQQQGLIERNGSIVPGQVYDPLFIFGLPVTPPVWTRSIVGSIERLILFQVLERRVLTYNPANPPAFRVEMGNVGQHAYRWQTDPEAAREWDALNWDTIDQDAHSVTARTDPHVIYTLEVERTDQIYPGGIRDPQATYRVYASQDGGATRDLRFTGSVGPSCQSALHIALLRPHNPQAVAGRIGLMAQCSQNPSELRGAGVTFLTSYDGGRTFLLRGQI